MIEFINDANLIYNNEKLVIYTDISKAVGRVSQTF